MKRKLSLVISAGLTIAVVLLSAYAWHQEGEAENLRNEVRAMGELLAMKDVEHAEMEKRIKADELFISGDYDAAMALYEEIIKDAEEKSIILHRTEARSRTDSLRMTLTAKEREQRDRMNTLQTSLEKEIETADSLYALRTDSVKRILSDEISRLKAELIDTREKLEAIPDFRKLEFYSKAGNKTTYFGAVANGRANGKGMGYYTTGNVYVGQWKDNLKHGEDGVFRWISGERYEGSYVKDKRAGYGVYYWANGEKYEGEWEDDQRSGIGTLFDRDNNIKLKGEWKKGELVNAIE